MWVTKHQSEANENSTVSTVESATREVAGPSEESEGEVGGWERPLGTRRCEKEPAACRAPSEECLRRRGQRITGPETGKSWDSHVPSFQFVSKSFWPHLPNISRTDHFSRPPCTTPPHGTQRGRRGRSTEGKEEGGLRCRQGTDDAGLVSPEKEFGCNQNARYGKLHICRF